MEAAVTPSWSSPGIVVANQECKILLRIVPCVVESLMNLQLAEAALCEPVLVRGRCKERLQWVNSRKAIMPPTDDRHRLAADREPASLQFVVAAGPKKQLSLQQFSLSTLLLMWSCIGPIALLVTNHLALEIGLVLAICFLVGGILIVPWCASYLEPGILGLSCFILFC